MLSYYLEWHMRRVLASLLLDDHDKPAGEAERESVVRKAKRSPAARAKAASKPTDDGFVVHSFKDLIAQLGTTLRNRLRRPDAAAPGVTFTMTATPTPYQRRALELLGVSTGV